MVVFIDVEPCSLVEMCRRLGDAYCFSHNFHGSGGSKHLETSVNLYETTRRNTTEDSHCLPFKL
jgi:hypothetical protein